MSVQSEINRLATAKTAIGTAIAGKGVAVPSGTKLDGMAALIEGIETGGEDVSAETAEYTSLLTDLEAAVDALPDAGSGGGSVETCTVTFISSSMPGNGEKVSYSALDIDGKITSNVETFVEEGTEIKVELNNVVCGSALSINYPAECTNIDGTASLIYADEYFLVFKAPNVANENCIVIL